MAKNPLYIRNSTAEFLIFTLESKQKDIEVRYENETLWLSQKMMAELFQCSIDNISLHLKNIFSSGELNENSVVEDYSVTASDGKKYRTKHYNLDAIIAVGYRVNSKKATQFRIWATGILKEYIIKGFAVVFLEKIIFENYLKESAQLEAANEEFISKLQIFSLNAVLITTQQLK